jgi:hypothetical protein
MRVVDHHALWHASEVAQCLAEKHFAIEALEAGVDLKEQQARVTQHRLSGLRLLLFAVHFHLVRRRIMLHLKSRLEVIAARWHNRRLADSLAAAKGRQR